MRASRSAAHGYALATMTGLKSGTLYPIFIRLARPGPGRGVLAGGGTAGPSAPTCCRLTACGLASAHGGAGRLGREASGGAGRDARQPIRRVQRRPRCDQLAEPGRGAAAAGRRRRLGRGGLAEAQEESPGWPRLAWRAGGVTADSEGGTDHAQDRHLAAVRGGRAAPGGRLAGPRRPRLLARADIAATVAAGGRCCRCWPAGCSAAGQPRGPLAPRAYAAILALMPAKAAIELFLGAVPRAGIDLHNLRALPESATVYLGGRCGLHLS